MPNESDAAGSSQASDGRLDPELAHILERALPGARVVTAIELGTDDAARGRPVTAKSAGYGVPIRLEVESDGVRRTLVLHGSSSNQFGHDRRADRAAELLLAADTFGGIPRHTRVLDVGAFRRDGSSVSLLDSAEFYLLTEFAPGAPYAEDLRRIARAQALEERDIERLRVLIDYLVELHGEQRTDDVAYARSLRDLLGAGEGIFGIVDAYPASAPGVTAERLQRLEQQCLAFRWRLKRRQPHHSRIHGDFHPFNVLFDERASLHVLDTSRGSTGDPADDVACMAVNYVFFALEDAASWRSAFRVLWQELWSGYLARTKDEELLSAVAPFLAWRLLVLACPVWYPNLTADARERLLAFAEAALAADRFDPELAEMVFR